MLGLEIELLRGQYVATAYNDRQTAEWPPHPARIFSALVATHYAADPPDPAERAALEWLEGQPPPSIAASAASRRQVTKVFVPINDTSVIENVDTQVGKLAAAEEAFRLATAQLAEAEASGADLEKATKALGKVRKAVDKAQKAVDKAREELSKRTQKVTGVLDKDLPAATILAAASLLPEGRSRKDRTFPVAIPDHPVVHLVWPDAEPEPAVRAALGRLVALVSRIGHSSSLVRCALVERAPEPDYHPDPTGTEVLRVTQQGQLAYLDAEFERHRETEPRVLPSAFQTYRHGAAPASRRLPRPLLGGEWIVFRHVRPDPDADGRRPESVTPPAVRAAAVAEALYGAVVSHAAEPVPEILTGHAPGGGPSSRPHVACVALANVGWQHADGRILGAALVLPKDISDEDRLAVLAAVGRWEKAAGDAPLTLTLGRAGVVRLARETGRPSADTVSPWTWRRPAQEWITATPIALDRHPGDLSARDSAKAAVAQEKAEAMVADACEKAGLPRPVEVHVMRGTTLRAVPAASAFGPFPRRKRPDRPQRVLVHATILFESPVNGPVLVGAGRYRGLGLCRPLDGTEAP